MSTKRIATTIDFEIDGQQYRFNRLDRANMVIERWEEVTVKKETKMTWVRVGGYHNCLSIQRELLELVAPDEAQTLKEYFSEINGRLADIGMLLAGLLPETQ